MTEIKLVPNQQSKRLQGLIPAEDTALVARILGKKPSSASTSQARALLESAGSLSDLFYRGPEQFRAWGLSRPQSDRLQAVPELIGRLGVIQSPRKIQSPDSVFDLCGDLRVSTREHFVGFYVNTKNVVLMRRIISVGSLDSSLVHPREVFEPALRLSAYGVIIVHNHPSGDPAPSPDDLAITRRLSEAAELLGIHLLDHLIVCRHKYLSLHAQGYL